MVDGRCDSKKLPDNMFFVAAINPMITRVEANKLEEKMLQNMVIPCN